jgi:hypothetical protein
MWEDGRTGGPNKIPTKNLTISQPMSVRMKMREKMKKAILIF